MGTTYKIRCKHCGARFDHRIEYRYGSRQPLSGGSGYVETERPMRCPACLHKLNASTEEFNEQVEVSYVLG